MKFMETRTIVVEVNEKEIVENVVEDLVNLIDEYIDEDLAERLPTEQWDEIVDTPFYQRIGIELRNMVIQKLYEQNS